MNKIKCIKLSLHEDFIKKLILNLASKRLLCISYEITDELSEAIVNAFSNNEEGVIIIPKK